MTIQFKIQIRGVKKPPVWRRIVIPENFTFHDLHNTIQSAFGWWSEHLYQFQRHPFGDGWCVKEPDDEDDDIWGESPEDANVTNVAAFIRTKRLEKFVYVYDFGDSWVHDITVEKIDDDAELEHPICLAGKSACPPEDCGGAWGYEELKEEMDKDEIEEFDLDEVNDELEDIRPSKSIRNMMRAKASDDDDDNYDPWDCDDDDSLPPTPSGDAPEPIKLMDVLKRNSKGVIIDLAEDLGIDIDEKSNVKAVREQFVKYVTDNPVKILRQLPMEDLMILDNLRKHPTEGLVVDRFRDYYESLMIDYDLADEWYDDDEEYFIQVPEDFWQAVSPHIKEVMDDMGVHRRVTVESIIIGLANLYGQVSVEFVANELVRIGQSPSVADAKEELDRLRDESLFMKANYFELGDPDSDLSDEDCVYLSHYGWELIEELYDVIEKHEKTAKDYKLFSEKDMLMAALSPMPLVPNPQRETFMNFLMEDMEMNEWLALETCHDLWFFEMHKEDEGFADDPGEYFREQVLYDYDSSDSKFRKGMKLLDDFLNNMPHWQLKGHTPAETMDMLSQEEKNDQHSIASRSQSMRGRQFSPMDLIGGIGVTMPIIAEKKPGRNDPCPCGSGKKYKNCCGRGN